MSDAVSSNTKKRVATEVTENAENISKKYRKTVKNAWNRASLTMEFSLDVSINMVKLVEFVKAQELETADNICMSNGYVWYDPGLDGDVRIRFYPNGIVKIVTDQATVMSGWLDDARSHIVDLLADSGCLGDAPNPA